MPLNMVPRKLKRKLRKMEIKTADWKAEKHVPVIEIEKLGEEIIIKTTVGKEIPHPNTFEHHIKWIEVYFEDDAGIVYPIGRAEFEGHGERGFTEPKAMFVFKPTSKGKIVAVSFCNIHGLWKSEVNLDDM